MTDLMAMHESLSGVVFAGRGRVEVFTEIAGIARRALPGSDAASITLIRGDHAFTVAHDGQLSVDADELQYELGHGPCVDAGRAAQVLRVHDMGTEQRWPDYAAAAMARGVRSSLSIPLPFQSATIGALNNYAGRTHAFSTDDIARGEEIASYVALAVANARLATNAVDELANMRIAMASRSIIDQAKGILIERHKITQELAFTMLSRASQKTNIKLRDLAEELVRTGAVPGSDRPPPSHPRRLR